MKNKMLIILLCMIALIAITATVSFADTGASDIYTVFSEKQVAQTAVTDSLGMDVNITTYSDSSVTANSAVALYVINHMGEYPGTDSDEDIITDLLNDGYIVTVLDYKNSLLAVSPNIEQSVQNIRLAMIKSGTYLGDLSFDSTKTYVLPAGYRIVRDVVYFEMAKQSSQETLDFIVETWNTQSSVQESAGDLWAKAESVYDIVMKDGSKMTDEDMQLKMDIIYPSNPTKKVPVAVIAASGTPRNNSTVSADHPDRIQSTGFLFRGYATVCYDHEYIPFMNSDVGGWGHFEPDYTIQGYDGIKTHTAAIRCIKYYADEYGYSDTKIGVYGHSKSSWSSLLSNPDSENLPENLGTCTALGKQPFLTDEKGNALNADITCCYHSMGVGSSRFAKYLTNQNVPTIICCGQSDSGNGCTYWEKEQEAYISSGIEYLAIEMVDEGHTYPHGDDTVYDYNRYVAFCKFFDYYLKDTAPEILFTSVKEGQIKDVVTTINPLGKAGSSVALTDAWKIVEGDKLFVQFVAPVTEWSFLKAATVTDSSGNKVVGSWYAEGNGNKWIFEGKLTEGETYTLTVADNTVSDKYGRVVEQGTEVTFTK